MDYAILEKRDYGRWDDFVKTSPEGSVYATTPYLEALGTTYRIAVVTKGDQIKGGIVLANNELRLNANPLFVKYLGVLHSPDASAKTSRAYAVDRLVCEHVPRRRVWSYTFHPNYSSWLPFFWEGFAQTTRYTYVVYKDNKEAFRKSYAEKVKGPLRKAKKHDLQYHPCDVETVVRLNRLTYERQGVPPPTKDATLTSFLRNLDKLGVLRTRCVMDAQQQIHAGAATVEDNKSAHMIVNGADAELRNMGGNSLLIDHLLDEVLHADLNFDFEGSMHENIESFYRGFGGRLTAYHHIYRKNITTTAYHNLVALYKRAKGY